MLPLLTSALNRYNPILEVLLDYDQLVLHNALLTLPHDELEVRMR
jgi:hypothetical protein